MLFIFRQPHLEPLLYAVNNSWKKEKELDQYVSLKMPD